MTSKKNGSKKLFENMPVEPEHMSQKSSDEANAALSESTDVASEPSVSEAKHLESGSTAESEPEELSPDDLLEDVRRSLIEEQAEHDKETRPKWWQRIGIGSRKNVREAQAPQVEEINLPRIEEPIAAESSQEVPPEEDAVAIDELIDMLSKEEGTSHRPAASG
jgi:hypothetical protein